MGKADAEFDRRTERILRQQDMENAIAKVSTAQRSPDCSKTGYVERREEAQDRRIRALKAESEEHKEWMAAALLTQAGLQERVEKQSECMSAALIAISDLQQRIEALEAGAADLKDSVKGLSQSMVKRILDIEELKAFKDAMAEAANVLQAESSPRVTYAVGSGTFEPDDVFDLRMGPR